MAIINREGDISEKKEWSTWVGSTQIVSGATQWMFGPMPYFYQIQSARSAAVGTSGAMQLAFGIQRFVSGASIGNGFTLISIGVSNMIVNNMGVSGILGYSGLATPGSTLLQGLPGDIIMFTSSGSNTAAQTMTVQMVWIKTDDIVKYNGVSN